MLFSTTFFRCRRLASGIRLLPLLLLPALGSAAEEQAPLPRAIVGGAAIDMVDYPFVVYVSGSRACSGSIVAPKWVLVAAGCVAGHNGTVKIEHGHGSSLGFREQIAKRLVPHPQYRGGDAPVNDIALIELTGAFPASYAAPLGIPRRTAETTHAPSGTQATALGWGKKEANQHSNEVREFTSSLYHPDYCRSQLAFTNEEQVAHSGTMCAGTATKKLNSGDWGGPLVVPYSGAGDVEYLLVGVASTNAKDSSSATVTSIFTRVSGFADWIDTTTSSTVTLVPSATPVDPAPAQGDNDDGGTDDDDTTGGVSGETTTSDNNDDNDDDTETEPLGVRVTKAETKLETLRDKVTALETNQTELKKILTQLNTQHGKVKTLQTTKDSLLTSATALLAQ